MLGEHIVPQSEVIRAILLEDSPCCGVPTPGAARRHCCRLRRGFPTGFQTVAPCLRTSRESRCHRGCHRGCLIACRLWKRSGPVATVACYLVGEVDSAVSDRQCVRWSKCRDRKYTGESALMAKTLPLPCGASAFAAKTLPLPCVATAFAAGTLPLPAVSTAVRL